MQAIFYQRTLTVEQRFWQKVQKTESCWTWIGAQFRNGYGAFSAYGDQFRAHRFAYELLKGPIPDGMIVHHTCVNPACVNPDHLECVSPADHLLLNDAWVERVTRTHCPLGHPYDDTNTYITKNGGRTCRECQRIAKRKWHRRHVKPRTHLPQRYCAFCGIPILPWRKYCSRSCSGKGLLEQRRQHVAVMNAIRLGKG